MTRGHARPPSDRNPRPRKPNRFLAQRGSARTSGPNLRRRAVEGPRGTRLSPAPGKTSRPTNRFVTDIFTKRKRSAVMALIRSHGNRDTELRLITIMRAHGITGWRRGASLQWKVEGMKLKAFRVKPDFVFRAHRLAVFVDGCFWHGCTLHATSPKTNAAFWRKNGARQRVDGHDAGVAPQRSAGVAVGGRPLGVNGHKSPPTAPATASWPAPSAPAAGACCGFGNMN